MLESGKSLGPYTIEREIGRGSTTDALFPGQVGPVVLEAPSDVVASGNIFRARIIIDSAMPTFQECRDDNNASADVEPRCLL